MVTSFFLKLRRNHDCKVLLLRVGCRSLDIYIRVIVWLMMVTFGEVDGQKCWFNNGVVRDADSGTSGCWFWVP